MTFWERIQQLCAEKRTTPTALCKSLGLSTSMSTRWKNGTIPNSSTMAILAEALGVTAHFLMWGSDEPIKKSPAVPTGKRGVQIPVLGNVAAGIPLEAITDIEDYEEIPEAMAAGGEFVALRIHGDSMEPRMTEGDVVIVRVQETIESGEIGIFIINGDEATCKKIKKTPDGIMLISNNPDYEPMFFSNQQVQELPVRVFGKVVELRAKFW